MLHCCVSAGIFQIGRGSSLEVPVDQLSELPILNLGSHKYLLPCTRHFLKCRLSPFLYADQRLFLSARYESVNKGDLGVKRLADFLDDSSMGDPDADGRVGCGGWDSLEHYSPITDRDDLPGWYSVP